MLVKVLFSKGLNSISILSVSGMILGLALNPKASWAMEINEKDHSRRIFKEEGLSSSVKTQLADFAKEKKQQGQSLHQKAIVDWKKHPCFYDQSHNLKTESFSIEKFQGEKHDIKRGLKDKWSWGDRDESSYDPRDLSWEECSYCQTNYYVAVGEKYLKLSPELEREKNSSCQTNYYLNLLKELEMEKNQLEMDKKWNKTIRLAQQQEIASLENTVGSLKNTIGSLEKEIKTVYDATSIPYDPVIICEMMENQAFYKQYLNLLESKEKK